MDAATTAEGSQPANYPGFEGRVGRVFATSEPAWRQRRTAPDGCAQRRGDGGRRPRVLRSRLLRQRDPHPEHRRPRRRRAALHQLPRGPAVLTDPGLAADRAQRPRRRHGPGRPHRRRVPRLRRRAARAPAVDGRDVPRQRLLDPRRRQVAPVQERRPLRSRRQALLAAAARVRPVLRLPRSADQLPPSPPHVRGQLGRRHRRSTPTATTSPTTSPTAPCG